jgi:hypothetical protein
MGGEKMNDFTGVNDFATAESVKCNINFIIISTKVEIMYKGTYFIYS